VSREAALESFAQEVPAAPEGNHPDSWLNREPLFSSIFSLVNMMKFRHIYPFIIGLMEIGI
jgi:hypothetical protein